MCFEKPHHMWLLAMGLQLVQNLCHGLVTSAMVFNYDHSR